VSARRGVAADEVQRILALVPYLVTHPRTAKRDLAARFNISREQVEADLLLVLMIGVPPYTPADYIDVEDDGERVTLRMAESFRRPLRLSPAEGLSLLAAGRTLLAVPGADQQGPLASALAKLERALGSPEVVVQLAAPEHLDGVREAVDAERRVEIEYWSAGREELTRRVVDPLTVFSAEGQWYLEAYCHRARADRLFRVDRIRSLVPTGEHFAPPAAGGSPPAVFHPCDTDPRVTIDLSPAAAWVSEHHPTEAVHQRDDGTVRVTLAISQPRFLTRLLLQLGPDARVVAPEAMRSAGAEAAGRVLDRYRARSGS
jgi:proteasome accessory factor C